MIVYGFVLATLAVAALLFGALTLRNEEHTQTKCAQVSAYVASRQYFPGFTRNRNIISHLLDQCTK